MSDPIMFHTEVKAEDAAKFPDMRLRLIIRQAVIYETGSQMTIDEALAVLKAEAEYLENRIRSASPGRLKPNG
jgi:hypothetical protein